MRRTFDVPKTVIRKQSSRPLSERKVSHMKKMQGGLQKFLTSRSYASIKASATKPKRDSRGRFIKRSFV